MSDYISKKRLYLDADGKPTEDDTKAVTLLVGENGSLPLAEAERLGLTSSDASTDTSETTEEPIVNEGSGLTINKATPETEDKAVSPPKARKQRRKK
jgi:hypothetical protein